MEIHQQKNISLSIGTGGTGSVLARSQADGKIIRRNSSHLNNLGRNQTHAFHDGRVQMINGVLTLPENLLPSTTQHFTNALDAQTLFPILSRDEMRNQIGKNQLSNIQDPNDYLVSLMSERILSNQDYLNQFKEVFPEETSFNPGHMARAMGAFIEFKYNVKDTPYDRYLKGESSVLTDSQKRGLQIFITKGQCIKCHMGENLTDNLFHSVGAPHIYPSVSSPSDDLGREEVTKDPQDRYKFKTPGFRNLKNTVPYMHNGTFQTLEEVVEHYNDINKSLLTYEITSKIQENYQEEIYVDKNILRNSQRFNQIDKRGLRRGLKLSSQEKADLVNFLLSTSH